MPMYLHRGGGSTAPTHSHPGTRKSLLENNTLRPLYPPTKTRYSLFHCTGCLVGLGAGLDGMEKSLPPPPPTGIRSPDRPSRRVVAKPTELFRLPYGRSFKRVLYPRAGAVGTHLSADNRDKSFLGLLSSVSLQY